MSSPESPPELQRSCYVEGHTRFGVISSVLMQQYLRTIRQRSFYQVQAAYINLPQHLAPSVGPDILIYPKKKTEEGMVDSQPMKEEFQGAVTRDVGTKTHMGPTKPVLQTQKTPSPSMTFIKENIYVLRTMIKEHDQQAKMKATPRKLAYVDSNKEALAKSLARALLARLATFVSKGMKALHVFMDSPKLVAQTEGNHMLATEQERKYKKEITDVTAPFHGFQITYFPKNLKSKAEVLTGLATIKLEFLNQEISTSIKTRPSVEETSSNKKGKAASNVPVSPEERMHSYAIRLKFNTSDHAIDCEALLARLATFVSK
nr:hypothetical protein [Tanacetum cinerariifolium]